MPMISAIVLVVGATTMIQVAPPQAEAPAFRVVTIREDAFRLRIIVLLRWRPIQDELKLTADRKKHQAAVYTQLRAKVQAADSEADALKDRDEAEATLRAALDPGQRARLDQIQLRLQGPSAFDLPDLPGRLGLTEAQATQARTIVEEGARRMDRASSIAPTWRPDQRPTTFEAVLERVSTPEFQAAKERAWRSVLECRDAAVGRIEAILTDHQRTAYREMLGPPYDPNQFWGLVRARITTSDDAAIVARALDIAEPPGPQQGNAGQRADPDFDTKVAKPAYAGDRHPKVFFDEAHHNFHTSGGRYKAFAELIGHDGYQVTPNREPFTPTRLAGSSILVIANALGAEGMGHPDAGKSAFTEAECDAVRDWVDAGGSLLLITDHQPFGDSADLLARRFGVDMSKGVTSDRANQAERGLLFSRAKKQIGDHAITRGRDESERVDRVLTFTGQSLKGPAGSVPFLKFADTAVDQLEDKEVSAAGRAQGIAFARGKGRVVVMGEAAQLSAQVFGLPPVPMGMNVPGCDNRRMALNTMHWLSRLID